MREALRKQAARMSRGATPLILLVITELAAGILLLVVPAAFTHWVLRAAGALLAVTGLAALIRALRLKKQTGEQPASALVLAVLALVLGAACVLFARWAVYLRASSLVYGGLLLLSALVKFPLWWRLRQEGCPGAPLALISAAAALLLGLVVLIDPFWFTRILWAFTGVCLLGLAGLDLAVLIRRGRVKPAADRAD